MVKKEEPLVREMRAFVNYINTGNKGDLSSVEDSIITLNISDGGKI